MKILTILALALLLLGSAPTHASAPARPAEHRVLRANVVIRQACPRETARFAAEREVMHDDLPLGHVSAWSCDSFAAVLAELDQREAAVRREACQQYAWTCDRRTP